MQRVLARDLLSFQLPSKDNAIVDVLHFHEVDTLFQSHSFSFTLGASALGEFEFKQTGFTSFTKHLDFSNVNIVEQSRDSTCRD